MPNLTEKLQRGYHGKAILFCGAGFSADSINWKKNSELGTAAKLLTFFNEKLKKNYKKLETATKKYKEKYGNTELRKNLKDNFSVQDITNDIKRILDFHWNAIYTTNYDDAIEQGLQKKQHTPLNNTDSHNAPISGIPVYHLHGYLNSWDAQNFESSCVLDPASYYNSANSNPFLQKLRADFTEADIVVFIGFSANDFYLNQAFYNAEGLKEKAFFINPAKAELNDDEEVLQEEFGQILNIGKRDFANQIENILKDIPELPFNSKNFEKITPVISALAPPTAEEIENFLIFGQVKPEYLQRDLEQEKSEYHVLRTLPKSVLELIQCKKRFFLLLGEICTGKSVDIDIIAQKLLEQGFTPYKLNSTPFHGWTDEVSKILKENPKSVFMIEDCFSYDEKDLLKICADIKSNPNAILIFSSRSVSFGGGIHKAKAIQEEIGIASLQEYKSFKLDQRESEALASLIFQIGKGGGITPFQTLNTQYILSHLEASLSRVLIEILKSDYAKDKLKTEWHKLSLTDKERHFLIGAFLLSNIGTVPTIDLLSDIFRLDSSILSKKLQDNALISIKNKKISLPSSLAGNTVLRSCLTYQEIIKVNLQIVRHLWENFYSLQQESAHLARQMTRYSILRALLPENISQKKEAINQFYADLKTIDRLRTDPLFWLQWHIAMVEVKDYSRAEDYLKQGFLMADERKWVGGMRRQLEDRKARFLIERSSQKDASSLNHALQEAINITFKLIQVEDLTHHAFITLHKIFEALPILKSKTISGELPELIKKKIKPLYERYGQSLSKVSDGYEKRAEAYLKASYNIGRKLKLLE